MNEQERIGLAKIIGEARPWFGDPDKVPLWPETENNDNMLRWKNGIAIAEFRSAKECYLVAQLLNQVRVIGDLLIDYTMFRDTMVNAIELLKEYNPGLYKFLEIMSADLLKRERERNERTDQERQLGE